MKNYGPYLKTNCPEMTYEERCQKIKEFEEYGASKDIIVNYKTDDEAYEQIASLISKRIADRMSLYITNNGRVSCNVPAFLYLIVPPEHNCEFHGYILYMKQTWN